MERPASNIYVSTEYPGVTLGFIVVPEGAIAIDAPTLPHNAREWRQKVVETAGGPIFYTVLTDGHPDRVLSADLLGAPLVASRAAYERLADTSSGFWRSVVDRWSRRYPDAEDELDGREGALPRVLVHTELTLHKGGGAVSVESIEGPAPGSLWIYREEEGVVFLGDTLVVGTHPHVEAATNTKGWLNTLTRLRRPRFANVKLVPGRGPISDQKATRPLSDYIALMRRRARSLIRGTIDQREAIDDLLEALPSGGEEPDLIERRIKAGLEQVVEELEPEEEEE